MVGVSFAGSIYRTRGFATPKQRTDGRPGQRRDTRIEPTTGKDNNTPHDPSRQGRNRVHLSGTREGGTVQPYNKSALGGDPEVPTCRPQRTRPGNQAVASGPAQAGGTEAGVGFFHGANHDRR